MSNMRPLDEKLLTPEPDSMYGQILGYGVITLTNEETGEEFDKVACKLQLLGQEEPWEVHVGTPKKHHRSTWQRHLKSLAQALGVSTTDAVRKATGKFVKIIKHPDSFEDKAGETVDYTVPLVAEVYANEEAMIAAAEAEGATAGGAKANSEIDDAVALYTAVKGDWEKFKQFMAAQYDDADTVRALYETAKAMQ